MRGHLEDEILIRMMDGELAPAEQAAVKEHLDQCHGCGKRFQEISNITAEVALFSVENLPSVHDSARDELLAALSRKENIFYSSTPMRGVSRVWMIGAAIAAMLALMAVLFGFRTEQQLPAEHGAAPVAVAQVDPDASQRVSVLPPKTDSPEQEKRPLASVPDSVKRRVRRRPAKERGMVAAARTGKNAGVSVPATEGVSRSFIELPYSDRSLPLSGLQVVRVQMRAAALASAGLIAAVPPTDERWVQADLLLGMDGQPRGIRFVPAVAASR